MGVWESGPAAPAGFFSARVAASPPPSFFCLVVFATRRAPTTPRLSAADVVCLQETKLRPSELSLDLCAIPGWHGYYSCSETGRAHAGVATFSRAGGGGGVERAELSPFERADDSKRVLEDAQKSVTEAEDGAGVRDGADARCDAPLSPPNQLDGAPARGGFESHDFSTEGRLVLTWHVNDSVALFNLYAPAGTSVEPWERVPLRLAFFRRLEQLWRRELALGRCVVSVGDYNVCPDDADVASGKVDCWRADRQWLRSWVHARRVAKACGGAGTLGENEPGEGPFEVAADATVCVENDETAPLSGAESQRSRPCPSPPPAFARPRLFDTFRRCHPGERRSFTCWSMSTRARELNQGARIDLALVGGGGVVGSWESCPEPRGGRDAALGDVDRREAKANGGDVALGGPLQDVRIAVVTSDVHASVAGSDHCPISTMLRFREHLPTVQRPAEGEGSGAKRGVAQTTLKELLRRRNSAPLATDRNDTWASTGAPKVAAGRDSGSGNMPGSRGRIPESSSRKRTRTLFEFLHPQIVASPATLPTSHQPSPTTTQAASSVLAGSVTSPEALSGSPPVATPTPPFSSATDRAAQPPRPPTVPDVKTPCPEWIAQELAAAAEYERLRARQSAGAWKSLVGRMRPPMCRHHEPAVRKRVNKAGENKGRWFFTCARPAGPMPKGNCGFFQWVEGAGVAAKRR